MPAGYGEAECGGLSGFPVVHGASDAGGCGRGIGGCELGCRIVEAIGECGREARSEARGFGIVEVKDHVFCAACKASEKSAQLVHRLVVERDVHQHGYAWIVGGDRAIAFVHFRDKNAAVADKGAGEQSFGRAEILHHRAVHHRGALAGLVKDPGDHAGDGGLAARARHADGEGRGVEQGRQHVRPAHALRARVDRGGNVRHRVFHRRRGDDHLLGSRHAAAILRIETDAARAQVIKFRRRAPLVERPVGALDDVALVEQDQSQRQHPGAADATEEIVMLVGHDGHSIAGVCSRALSRFRCSRKR